MCLFDALAGLRIQVGSTLGTDVSLMFVMGGCWKGIVGGDKRPEDVMWYHRCHM